jgi:hypothetical protein
MYVLLMMALGGVETLICRDFFQSNGVVNAVYALRLAAGLLMLSASVYWLHSALVPNSVREGSGHG